MGCPSHDCEWSFSAIALLRWRKSHLPFSLCSWCTPSYLITQSSSEVTVALMTLETALKAASMQRMPTPKTTEGAPPSAAMAAVGVMRTAGTAALAAISRGVPRSCACGPGAPRKATLRSATNATSVTHSVINLDERAMATVSLFSLES